ncbi:MAG: DHH family phosphoesterase [Coriobacteriia bacterium]|nr:DHH family phosphoesterase [Coriobacteriia bacterium]
MTNIYVFGHKNPDNDSIVSAAVYAEFLNYAAGDDSDVNYVAARLGDIPPETRHVFERFDATDMLPEMLPEPAPGAEPLKVVLVDHNEYAQSADGIRDMEIVEVLDHHRLGGIETAAPISFMCLPYGSTATLVTIQYMDTEAPMPHWAAGVLLSAVLTDTVIMKSPTTTDVDRDIIELLASAVEVDPQEFGLELFKVRSEATPFEPSAILQTDLKEYDKDGAKIAIVQYESATLDPVDAARDVIVEEMNKLAAENGWDLFVFMATDIIKEGSELFVAGDLDLARKAFDADFAPVMAADPFKGASAWMPGVLSRKKQVAAAIMDA